MLAIDTVTGIDTNTNGSATADAISQAIADVKLQPARAMTGARSTDIVTFIQVDDDAAKLLTDGDGNAPIMRMTGARSKTADTAADRLMAALLKVDGGSMVLLPVTDTVDADGRAKGSTARLAKQLDDAFLRLNAADRLRIVYGRAADKLVSVQAYGTTLTATLPGPFYIMATGGRVKSHPVMGRFYNALTGALGPRVPTGK